MTIGLIATIIVTFWTAKITRDVLQKAATQ
jgi:hypothetical protein